ncbi:hypothetical protein [Kibdelosporangium phytohabitans]|uniref:Glycosyltransferase n=1 Tax=Kibdelosporangium phytohabitans TaxID=860235 RepID=A0A0N9ICE9_9PSEU|nr:hypothetical protein [Kibdelosporangium phytohabitans]ALG12265.1 hypothetical protein AOZ06_40250 [Kibdelosporangium phytohabitans]MBE1463817.1 hypothetical protein [Kibdelosporangium phytohabitans]
MERALVNFFYCHPVGHAVEALYYANGHHAANPDLEISVALNAATAVELAGFCPFVSASYAVDHPLLESCPDSLRRVEHLPRHWDWVIDESRRYQDFQLELFPGLKDYYDATDQHLVPGKGRTVVTSPKVGYLPHQQLRLQLPEHARRAAEQRTITIMPGGSSEPELYPSADSWLMIMDALTDAYPDARIVLVGKLAKNDRTSTALTEEDLARLLAHRSGPVNCFDRSLTGQLAAVEASDFFLAPHTGFGMAALAVGTPWLALSGGRWFEFFFNGVPFRSIIPDTDRFPSYSTFGTLPVVDSEDGPRTPSMTQTRIHADLDRIVAAAGELRDGTLGYEQALHEYFPALLEACGGDKARIWSIDAVHMSYL